MCFHLSTSIGESQVKIKIACTNWALTDKSMTSIFQSLWKGVRDEKTIQIFIYEMVKYIINSDIFCKVNINFRTQKKKGRILGRWSLQQKNIWDLWCTIYKKKSTKGRVKIECLTIQGRLLYWRTNERALLKIHFVKQLCLVKSPEKHIFSKDLSNSREELWTKVDQEGYVK